jgi:tRNA-dihydrouridine synthase C
MRLLALSNRSSSSPSSSSFATTTTKKRNDDQQREGGYYRDLFSRGRTTKTTTGGGCPALFLAPMEGLGDRRFRRAISIDACDAYDDVCKEFTRVPGNLPNGAKAEKFIKKLSLHDYDAFELGRGKRRVSAQLMGSNAELLEMAAKELASEGEAPRVDLNCGCPANVVTGKGAGSSLLLDPMLVNECMRSVANGCRGYAAVPSLKMRIGFDDASLFRENVHAACEGGAEILTVHGRTRKQGYRGEADWEKIAEAKSICEKFGVMVVGNGDVTSCERAARILRETNCDGVMIGRGAVQDPLLFRRIKSRVRRDASGRVTLLSEEEVSEEHKMRDEAERVILFLRAFYNEMVENDAHESEKSSSRGKVRMRTSKKGIKKTTDSRRVGKLKSIVKYLFAGNPHLAEKMQEVVGVADHETESTEMLRKVEGLVERYWKGEPGHVAVDNFSSRTGYVNELTTV